MENKEFIFKGKSLNGFMMLFFNILLILITVGLFIYVVNAQGSTLFTVSGVIISILLFISTLIMLGGYMIVEPNEARVMMLFGKYKGTFTHAGFYWVNPFINTKRLSLRARNLDVDPIKVNDKIGNPIMIGLVLVWKLNDTYKAMFDIDAQTIAQGKTTKEAELTVSSTAKMMNALENFVKIQSDAALRQVAGQYAYDDTDNEIEVLTLRSGGEEINQQLEKTLDERLSMAGINIVEARINYLAYAPEIAAVMLRRQQASAIISAREKIVEGAVSMVKMALDKLSEDQIVELDEDKKAAMVSNLMVVLCGDDTPQPVINAGTLNH